MSFLYVYTFSQTFLKKRMLPIHLNQLKLQVLKTNINFSTIQYLITTTTAIALKIYTKGSLENHFVDILEIGRYRCLFDNKVDASTLTLLLSIAEVKWKLEKIFYPNQFGYTISFIILYSDPQMSC